jgi:hypothetical protein
VKRFLSLAVVLLIAAPLFALDNADRDRRDDRRGPTVVDEVIRMSAAGVADSAIIDWVNNSRGPFAVTSDDLIALTNAHVSEAVIRAVQNDSSNRDTNARYPRSTVLVSPYVYGYPYYYSPYYDPFFYPRLSIGFGFGFGRGFGGGFRHR